MKKEKIKEKDLIEAEKGTSLGFTRCAICGCELEMTKKFIESEKVRE